MRAIIHFKIESFFATIESKRQTDLVGKPIAVAKGSGSAGGVIISASKEAASGGVTNGMTIRHAQKVCPGVTILSADYPLYYSVHANIMDVLSHYSPLLEPNTLDSAWLDVTGCGKLFGEPKKITTDVMRKISELGYSVRVGIASNKLVAQIASDEAKALSCKLINPGDEKQFLSPLLVSLLPGVGVKTVKRLADLGIKSIGQLAMIPKQLLIQQFGALGERVHTMANGVDHSLVKAMWPPDTIIIEHMFSSTLSEPADIEAHLGLVAESLALKLRSYGRLAQMVTLGLLADNAPLPGYWRLKHPINQTAEIHFALNRLLSMQMTKSMEVGGIIATLSDLTMGEGLQLALIGTSERKRRLDNLMETIHHRFGNSALCYATSYMASGRERVLHRVSAA